MSDESKAIEESAKTIGKGIDLAEKVGGFIAPLIKGSIEQGVGIFEDKLKYARWERANRLMERANEFMKESGIYEVSRPLPLKLAVPLLQGASLEDDDYLQDLWAKLLVNAVNDKNIELKRVYIDILERLSPLESVILEKIYMLPFNEIRDKELITYNLPDSIEIRREIGVIIPYPCKPEVELALINLSRVGCILLDKPGEHCNFIRATLLGRYFYEACTIKIHNVI